jgi:hypothetical protein
MIVRTVFLCNIRDAMARDKIQKMTVDKVIQRSSTRWNQIRENIFSLVEY